MDFSLPMNFIVLEQEEMFYLDGGGYRFDEGWGSWGFHFTKSDCSTIAQVTTGAAIVLGVLSFILSKTAANQYGAISKISAGIISFISSQFLRGAYGNEMRIYFQRVVPNWYRIL